MFTGEFGLVAHRGAVLEVKARADERAATVAPGTQQRIRIERAALAILQRHPALSGCGLCFGLMLVVPWQWPRHTIDAWRPPSRGSI